MSELSRDDMTMCAIWKVNWKREREREMRTGCVLVNMQYVD